MLPGAVRPPSYATGCYCWYYLSYVESVSELPESVMTSSEGWGHGGTPRRSNTRATLQGLNQRSKWKK